MSVWITRRWSGAVAPMSMVVLVCGAIASGSGDLLSVLPALLLGCLLLARRYPGERVLIALHESRRVRWPRALSAKSRRTRSITAGVRGGLLIGRSLAVRPPPTLSRAPS